MAAEYKLCVSGYPRPKLILGWSTEGGIPMVFGDLAHALRRYGIRIASAYEGDDDEDGDLTVGANVRMPVPTFGDVPRRSRLIPW